MAASVLAARPSVGRVSLRYQAVSTSARCRMGSGFGSRRLLADQVEGVATVVGASLGAHAKPATGAVASTPTTKPRHDGGPASAAASTTPKGHEASPRAKRGSEQDG